MSWAFVKAPDLRRIGIFLKLGIASLQVICLIEYLTQLGRLIQYYDMNIFQKII